MNIPKSFADWKVLCARAFRSAVGMPPPTSIRRGLYNLVFEPGYEGWSVTDMFLFWREWEREMIVLADHPDELKDRWISHGLSSLIYDSVVTTFALQSDEVWMLEDWLAAEQRKAAEEAMV